MFKLFFAVCWRNCPATKYQICHTHRASVSGKIKSNSCKWLVEHFSTGICKNAKYFLQIIEKWKGNGRISRGAIDLGEAVVRRKRETMDA